MFDNMMHWSETDPFWDSLYALENVLDYWTDHRIDHALTSYADWAGLVDL